MLTYDPLPPYLRLVWTAFRDLSGARTPSMGLSPITFSEMDAWCRVNGVALSGWEIDTIRSMDAVTLKVFSTKKGTQ